MRERRRSFERLYRQHHRDVYRRILREVGSPEEAEDVTQTAFLNAFRAMERGAAPARPTAWLHAIAENVRRKRFILERRRPPQVPLEEQAIADPSAEAAVSADELRVALAGLPAAQRRALLLREIQGLSYGEIADDLELSVASIQMLLFRARRTARKTLAPRGFGLVLSAWLQNAFGFAAGSAGSSLAIRTAAVTGAVVLGAGVPPQTDFVSPAAGAPEAAAAVAPVRVVPRTMRRDPPPARAAPATKPHAARAARPTPEPKQELRERSKRAVRMPPPSAPGAPAAASAPPARHAVATPPAAPAPAIKVAPPSLGVPPAPVPAAALPPLDPELPPIPVAPPAAPAPPDVEVDAAPMLP